MKKKYYDGGIVTGILFKHLEAEKMFEVLTAFAEAKGIDAVEVIRCKDCAEWRLARDGEGECYDGMADGAMTHETDFCSWARRRTDDE